MEFIVTAVLSDKSYHHFGIHPKTASLYGDKVEDIVNVTLKISEDQTIPEPNCKFDAPDYWGWVNGDNKISMIYPQRFLLNMCFPYGIHAAEKHGDGKSFRVEIIKISNYA